MRICAALLLAILLGCAADPYALQLLEEPGWPAHDPAEGMNLRQVVAAVHAPAEGNHERHVRSVQVVRIAPEPWLAVPVAQIASGRFATEPQASYVVHVIHECSYRESDARISSTHESRYLVQGDRLVEFVHSDLDDGCRARSLQLAPGRLNRITPRLRSFVDEGA